MRENRNLLSIIRYPVINTKQFTDTLLSASRNPKNNTLLPPILHKRSIFLHAPMHAAVLPSA